MFGRNLTGIAIDRGGAVALEAEKSGRLWSLKKVGGCVHTAAVEGEDLYHLPASVVREMGGAALLDGGIKKANVSFSVPDALAKTVILDFDELPGKAGEAMGVISWKVAKSMYLAPEDIFVGYQLLGSDAGGGVRVLAVAMKRDMVERYEDALFDVGCSVARVGTHTLSLLNLISAVVEDVGNFAVVFVMGGYFSISFFKDGVIDFYRSKSVGGEAGQLATEVGTSFTYYRGRNHGIEFERTFLVNGDEEAASLVTSVTGTDVVMLGADELIKDGASANGADKGVDRTALIAALGAASF